MKISLALSIIALIGGLSACNQNSPTVDQIPSNSIVRIEGSELIDSTGNPIHLVGTNLGNWLVPEGYMFKMNQVSSPRKIDELLYEMIGPDSLKAFWLNYLDSYITQEDIAYLKQIGCNHVRLPFHYKLFTDQEYMATKNAGFTYLDRLVNWCRKEGLYVLLDMHCAPGGQTGDNIDDSYGYPYLLFSEASQEELSHIWKEIAAHYANDPVVIGYDIVNEPVAHYFQESIPDYNDRLFVVYQKAVEAIREVDKRHAIFLNGSIWANDFGVFKSKLDEAIVYEFHRYWFDVTPECTKYFTDFRDSLDVPIYIGETGENTDEWILQFREHLEREKIHWAFWPYKKMNNTRGIMNFQEPATWKLISEYAEADRSSFEMIRKHIPNRDSVQLALNQFIENCKYPQCYENAGYINGLGLKAQRK